MKLLRFTLGCVFLLLYLPANAQYWGLVGSYGPNNSVTSIYGDSVLNKLIISGNFWYYDSLLVYGLCTWDGNNIETVGDSLYCPGSCQTKTDMIRYNDYIYLSFYGNEEFVNHDFNGVCRWNGESWDSLMGNDLTHSGGFGGAVSGFSIIDDKLYITGGFDHADIQPVTGIAIWDGIHWEGLEFPGIDFAILNCAAKFDNKYYFAGNINYLGSDGEYHDDIIEYDGENWYPMNLYGFSSAVSDLIVYKGELYISGGFSQQEGNEGDKIMKLQNGEWVKVGNSGGGGGAVDDMIIFHDELYIAGVFDYVDGSLPAKNIAKWDGEKWCSLGNDFLVTIQDLTVWHDSLFVAGGYVENPGFPPIIYSLYKWIGGDYVSQCGEPVAVKEIPRPTHPLRLYPNPVRGNRLTAECREWGEERVKVSVYNSVGRLVLRQECALFGGKTTIALPEGMPAGYYTMSLESVKGRAVAVQKFVRMN